MAIESGGFLEDIIVLLEKGRGGRIYFHQDNTNLPAVSPFRIAWLKLDRDLMEILFYSVVFRVEIIPQMCRMNGWLVLKSVRLDGIFHRARV